MDFQGHDEKGGKCFECTYIYRSRLCSGFVSSTECCFWLYEYCVSQCPKKVRALSPLKKFSYTVCPSVRAMHSVQSVFHVTGCYGTLCTRDESGKMDSLRPQPNYRIFFKDGQTRKNKVAAKLNIMLTQRCLVQSDAVIPLCADCYYYYNETSKNPLCKWH